MDRLVGGGRGRGRRQLLDRLRPSPTSPFEVALYRTASGLSSIPAGVPRRAAGAHLSLVAACHVYVFAMQYGRDRVCRQEARRVPDHLVAAVVLPRLVWPAHGGHHGDFAAGFW